MLQGFLTDQLESEEFLEGLETGLGWVWGHCVCEQVGDYLGGDLELVGFVGDWFGLELRVVYQVVDYVETVFYYILVLVLHTLLQYILP